MTGGKRFSDEEVRLVLRRAAELQQEDIRPGDSSRAMSLAEIEQAASEAGIDRALVRRAAGELRASARRTETSAFLGGPKRIVLERVVDGEVSEDLYEVLVEEIRRGVGEIGTVSTLGRSLAWNAGAVQAGGTGRNVQITVVPRSGRTTVRIEENLTMLAGAMFGGILGGVGGGGLGFVAPAVVLLGSPVLLPFAFAGWIGGVYVLVRRAYARRSNGRERELTELIDRLADMCVESSPPGA